MEWGFIVALVLGIPLVLVPVALVWYINIAGTYSAIKDARRKKAAREEAARAAAEERREEKELVGARQ